MFTIEKPRRSNLEPRGAGNGLRTQDTPTKSWFDLKPSPADAAITSRFNELSSAIESDESTRLQSSKIMLQNLYGVLSLSPVGRSNKLLDKSKLFHNAANEGRQHLRILDGDR